MKAFAPSQSIKYNFKGAPAEWMRVMTEVFMLHLTSTTSPLSAPTSTPAAL
jgi:hypothetical protein